MSAKDDDDEGGFSERLGQLEELLDEEDYEAAAALCSNLVSESDDIQRQDDTTTDGDGNGIIDLQTALYEVWIKCLFNLKAYSTVADMMDGTEGQSISIGSRYPLPLDYNPSICMLYID